MKLVLEEEDVPIIFAAMCAMVQEIHAPQDVLTDEQWDRAGELWKKVLELETKRRGK